jgi:hypothetical protein
MIFSLVIVGILSSGVRDSPARSPGPAMLETAPVPMSTLTRVGERHDHVVERRERDLLVASRASIDLYGLVGLDRAYLGHLARCRVLDEVATSEVSR